MYFELVYEHCAQEQDQGSGKKGLDWMQAVVDKELVVAVAGPRFDFARQSKQGLSIQVRLSVNILCTCSAMIPVISPLSVFL